MGFYVYIIQSLVDGSYYKGFTENPTNRLISHNKGESQFTRNKVPWYFVFLEAFASKKEGLIREKVIKKYSRAQIRQLVASERNQIVHLLASEAG